jgi:hypothetical protein
MADDRTEAVKVLLVQAEAAHGTFEATELKGVYDQEWARWYAAYAVEHGIGALIGHDVSADELAHFLDSSYVEFQRTEPETREPWAGHTARRIAGEL